MKKFLDGYKMYIVGYSAILFAILNAIFKWLPIEHSIYFLYGGFSLIGVKSAIAKVSK